jgi:hypothetical protein
MASSSSHNNSSIPLATLLEWYKIRDTFFGHNRVDQNISLALEMCASCDHPDARWLTEACAGKDVNTKEDAKRVFSALGQNDARALCFLCLLGGGEDFTPLRRSAELGFAFAQAFLAYEMDDAEEDFKFAQLSAAQGERDGLHVLGWCYSRGGGCEEDLDKAKENFLRGSELGFVPSMISLGQSLDELDPQRWRWWGQAAALGDGWNFLCTFAKQFELFNSGSRSVLLFAIGRALQGHVNEEARTIFGGDHKFDSRIGPAKQAIAFYEAQIKATKAAMHAWTQVGIRWKVVKDVRKLIAKLIWDSREEALFDVSTRREQERQEEQPSASAVFAQKRARK